MSFTSTPITNFVLRELCAVTKAFVEGFPRDALTPGQQEAVARLERLQVMVDEWERQERALAEARARRVEIGVTGR